MCAALLDRVFCIVGAALVVHTLNICATQLPLPIYVEYNLPRVAALVQISSADIYSRSLGIGQLLRHY